jgi:hypothetical protein
MTTSIHESFIYPILSRAPPQSFSVQLKQFEPSVPPAGRDYYTSQDRVSFTIRGEPNEFLLNDKTFLTCALRYTQFVDLGVVPLIANEALVAGYQNKNSPFLTAVQHGPCWIGQLKESVNGGGLEVFNLSDPAETPFYLALRGMNSSRNVQVDSAGSGVIPVNNAVADNEQYNTQPVGNVLVPDAAQKDGLRWENLEGCGFGNRKQRVNGCLSIYKSGAGAGVYSSNGAVSQQYAIPLSYISRLAGSASAVPIGLLSSYASPSWRIEMTLANVGEVLNSPITWGDYATQPTAKVPVLENNRYEIRDLRIQAVTVKIFDEGIMQSILALYNKVEVESVSGVPVPVSLTMPLLNQETTSYSLPQGSGNIKLLIPSTKHSVRGMFLHVVPEKMVGVDPNFAPDPDGRISTRGRYLDSNKFHYKYVQIKAGGTCLQESPVSEDSTHYGAALQSDSMKAWISQQREQASHLYSAFSYHSERAVQNGQTGNSFSLLCGNRNGWNDDSTSQVMPFGCSFENIPYADLYQGRVMSSGLDLSNTGRLEVNLEYGSITSGTFPVDINGTPQNATDMAKFDKLDAAYRLFVVLVYDQILEVSRSGTKDISDSVLSQVA